MTNLTYVTMIVLLLAICFSVAAKSAKEPRQSRRFKAAGLLFGAAAIIIAIYDLLIG